MSTRRTKPPKGSVFDRFVRTPTDDGIAELIETGGRPLPDDGEFANFPIILVITGAFLAMGALAWPSSCQP